METTRTVSADPGLLTPEELLKNLKDGRRKTLEEIIAQKNSSVTFDTPRSFLRRCRDHVRWFLDTARLKISVSPQINEFFQHYINHVFSNRK